VFFSNMFYNIATRFLAIFTHVLHTQYDISHYTYPSNLTSDLLILDSKYSSNYSEILSKMSYNQYKHVS